MFKINDIKSIEDVDVSNKRVIVRVDYNVPISSGIIQDNTRILRSLETIKYLLNHNATVILMSHLGRPKGIDESLRLDPVAKELEKLLNSKDISCSVIKFNNCVDENINKEISDYHSSKGSEKKIFLLENLRFNPGETKNDYSFSKSLASLADIYVNDAFGTMHRAHSSTVGITEFLKSYVGFLVKKEIDNISKLFDPEKPFISIIGCAKIKDKLPAIKSLLDLSDKVLFGGGIIFSFYKRKGYEIGKSLYDDSEEINYLLENYSDKIILPEDVLISKELKSDSSTKIVDYDKIEKDYYGVDIGPKTISKFKELLKDSKSVVWNGPLGIFEIDKFSTGTKEIAAFLNSLDSFIVIGGGDTVSAIKKFNLNNYSHISTGGGAFLELLANKTLVGIDAIIKSQK